MKWIETRTVGDPARGLAVELRRGVPPCLVIVRDNGGLVHIELDETRDLCAVIAAAAADLAAAMATDETKGD